MERPVLDFLNRQQVYIEGVKNWHGNDFRRYLKLMADQLRKLLAGLGVKSLGDLTKRKLASLIKTATERVGDTMGQYGTEFLREVQRFTRIDFTMQRSAWAVVKPKADLSGVSLSGAWTTARDRVVPAFGSTMKDRLVTLSQVAKDKVRVALNQGAVQNEPLPDTTERIVGNERSVLGAIWNDAKSVAANAFQHATSVVSETLASIIYDCYRWAAVLDNRTSDFCRETNGQVFRYGNGPRAPAHPYCRSREIPVACDDADNGPVPTFFGWLKTQPAAFLSDAFGSSMAKRIASGAESAQKAVSTFLDYPP